MHEGKVGCDEKDDDGKNVQDTQSQFPQNTKKIAQLLTFLLNARGEGLTCDEKDDGKENLRQFPEISKQ